MGEYQIVVESFQDGAWNLLPELHFENGEKRRLCTIPHPSKMMDLIVSDQAIFETQAHFGFLEDASELIRGATQGTNHWTLDFDDLRLEHWDDPIVLVTVKVKGVWVRYFGDGKKTFPHTALYAGGMDRDELEELAHSPRATHLAESPIDWTVKWHDESASQSVTWYRTIATMFGNEICNALCECKRLHPREKMRLIIFPG